MFNAIIVVSYMCVLCYILSSTSLPDRLGILTVPTLALVAALLIAAGKSSGEEILVLLGGATIGTPLGLAAYVYIAFLFFRYKPWK